MNDVAHTHTHLVNSCIHTHTNTHIHTHTHTHTYIYLKVAFVPGVPAAHKMYSNIKSLNQDLLNLVYSQARTNFTNLKFPEDRISYGTEMSFNLCPNSIYPVQFSRDTVYVCMYVYALYMCIYICNFLYVFIIKPELAYSALVAVKKFPSSEYFAPNACVT